MKNIYLAELVKLLHILMFIYVIFGCFLITNKTYLKYYLLFIILIFLDWNDLDGMCILTRLEHYFRTGEWSSKSPIEGGPEFFRPIFNYLFNINLSRIQADRLNNFIFIICWLIGFLRLLKLLSF
jgi:hypothetical protein